MRPGEVLVAASPPRPGPRSSPWPPAVVTDVGGPLSHSSIVAREYGIPAVLGTGVAPAHPLGPSFRLDGDAGTVTLLGGSRAGGAAQAPPAPVLSTWPRGGDQKGGPLFPPPPGWWWRPPFGGKGGGGRKEPFVFFLGVRNP